jgi:hypothetical protein
MDWLQNILAIVGLLFVGAIVMGLVQGSHIRNAAKRIENQIKQQPAFTASDLYVSRTSLTGLAIDNDRKEILLVELDSTRLYRAGDIVGCEVLLDDIQMSYTNRGSQIAGAAVGGVLLGGIGAVVGGLTGSRRANNNIRKIALRITVDDFDRPNHEITMAACLPSNKKGLSKDHPAVKKSLEAAQRWQARVAALMRTATPIQAPTARPASRSVANPIGFQLDPH